MTDKEYEEALAIVEKRKATRVPELLGKRKTLIDEIGLIDAELTKLNVAVPSSIANGSSIAKPTASTADKGYTNLQRETVVNGLDGKTVTSGQFAELIGLAGGNDAGKAKKVREAMQRDGIIEFLARANGFNMMYVWLKGQTMGVPMLKR